MDHRREPATSEPERRWRRAVLGALTILLTVVIPTSHAAAAEKAPELSFADALPHLEALQGIADRNGGNRAFATPGYAESLSYVRGILDEAGFRTHLEPFEHKGKKGTNLIADWPGGDPNQVVFLGAHLDSVPAGPGLNDNGSGVAATLATALALAESDAAPSKHIRFAWWGAEEEGLVGSADYVTSRSEEELNDIDVYLNFDMVGTKDPASWVLSDVGHPSSDVFREYFEAKGLPILEVQAGGSDHVSFHNRGVPVSGFSTGLNDCYHKPCDRLDRIDPKSQEISTDAIANTLWEVADVR